MNLGSFFRIFWTQRGILWDNVSDSLLHQHLRNLALFIIASYIHSFFLSLRLTLTSTALFALAASPSPNYSPSLNAPSASRAPPSLNTSPPSRAPPSPLLLLLCPASSSCSCWICRPISASRTNGKKCGQFKRAAAGRIYHENPIKSGNGQCGEVGEKRCTLGKSNLESLKWHQSKND